MKRGLTLLVVVLVLLAGAAGSASATAQATTSGPGGFSVVEDPSSGSDDVDTDIISKEPLPCKHALCGP